MNQSFKCSCGEVLLTKSLDSIKVKGKVTIIKGTSLLTVCKACHAEVALPGVLNLSIEDQDLQPLYTVPKSSRRLIIKDLKK